MIVEFIRAFTLIFVAEMGDKTQILAMTFATKYKIKKVLLGIGIGSFLNHGIAVILGNTLSNYIPIDTMQILAGALFIAFALMTLRVDEESEEVKYRFGPTLTVAIAFFIGELGDKTQLTAIVLATDANFPFIILLGTVTGMLVTGGLGIFVGIKLGSRLPEFIIKLGSAVIFMIFGVTKLINNLNPEYVSLLSVSIFIVLLLITSFLILKPTLEVRRRHQTAVQLAAQRLADFIKKISSDIDDICLGEHVCGSCQQTTCIVGATKALIKGEVDNFSINEETLKKAFNQDKVRAALVELIKYIDEFGQNEVLVSVKMKFELILFSEIIDVFDLDEYKKIIKNKDRITYRLLKD